MSLISNIKKISNTSNTPFNPSDYLKDVDIASVQSCIKDTSVFYKAKESGENDFVIEMGKDYVKLVSKSRIHAYESFEIDFEKWERLGLPKHIMLDSYSTFVLNFTNFTKKVSGYTFEDINPKRVNTCEIYHIANGGKTFFKDNHFKNVKLGIYCYDRAGKRQVQNVYFTVDGSKIKPYVDFTSKILKKYILNGNIFENLRELTLADFAVTIPVPEDLETDEMQKSKRVYISDKFRNIKYRTVLKDNFPFINSDLLPVLEQKIKEMFFGENGNNGNDCKIILYKQRGGDISGSKYVYNKPFSEIKK